MLSDVNSLRRGREGGGGGGIFTFVGVSKALALKRVQLLFLGGFCGRVGSGSGCCILSICLMRSSSLDDVEDEIFFSAIASIFWSELNWQERKCTSARRREQCGGN